MRPNSGREQPVGGTIGGVNVCRRIRPGGESIEREIIPCEDTEDSIHGRKIPVLTTTGGSVDNM